MRGAGFLISIELWLVGLAAGAAIIVPALLPWAVGIAGSFWLLRWLVTRRPTQPTPVDLPIGLLALMLPVTLWATALPAKTGPQVLRLLTGLALFYTVINWANSQRRLRFIVTGTIGLGTLLGVASPTIVLWTASDRLPFIPADLYTRVPTLVADTANPNVMAGFLALFTPLALAIALVAWPALSRLERGLILLGLLIPGAGLVLTLSRGGLLALGAALMVITLLRWRFAWLFWLAAVLGAGLAVRSTGVVETLNLLTSNPTLGGLEGRLEVWSRAVYMIQDFPFTGVGMGSFTEVADLLYPFFLYPPGKVLHAHNLFLQIAVDLGLPGLIAWLSIWLLVIASAWQIYSYGRRNLDRWAAGLGVGLLASQVALGVHGLVDAVTWGQVRPAPLVWALWGLAFASWNVLVGPAKEAS